MRDEIAQQDDPNLHDPESEHAGWAVSAIVSDIAGISDTMTNLETRSAERLVDLLRAVQNKDRSAFEGFYDATVQRVFGLALRITRRQELAEEVVSDVYLQVWQKAASYSSERGNVIAWLCVLCRSRALDALRRNNTAIQQAVVVQDSVPELTDNCEPVDLLHAVEQGSAVHTALGKLTEQQRQLVGLAYFRGYTHSELAAMTDMPVGTVKTHLHRAMIRLKELMSAGMGENG